MAFAKTPIRQLSSILYPALLGFLAVAAGCATMLSDEQVTDAYNRCVGRGDGSTLQAVYCGQAIDSGKLTRDELASAYAMRCRINQSRGREIEARRDCELADRAAGNFVAERPPPQAIPRNEPAPRRYQLVFNGMYCPRVQRDSMFHPANEIFANVVVIDEDGRSTKHKLPRSGIYGGVKAGSKRSASQPLWSGEAQALAFQIAVWERDDGGPAVEKLTDIAVDFALTRGRKTLTKAVVKGTVARRGATMAAREATETLDLTGQLSHHISSLPKALVGANNDLIGAVGIKNVYPDRYGPPQTEAGFHYHLRSRHTRGGADCRFYFQFR